MCKGKQNIVSQDGKSFRALRRGLMQRKIKKVGLENIRHINVFYANFYTSNVIISFKI